MSAAEIREFLTEFDRASSEIDGPFCVFVDMRTLVPMDREGVATMVEVQRIARERGMERSAVITTNPATIQQFKRIAGDSGIHRTERYINANLYSAWEQISLDWLLHGVEPPESTPAPTPTPLSRS